jgi:succinoglycan biosynthesis transport protein ExoP
MQERLAELKKQADDADRRVLEYKLANNLFNASEKIVTSHQMGAQVGDARLSMIDAQTRLQGAQQSDKTELYIPDNELINKLRAQYLDIETRAREMESRVGKSHAATVMLHKRMEELKSAMAAERERLTEAYAVQYELAKKKFQELTAKMTQTNESQSSRLEAGARELERVAETFRGLYNSMLTRITEESKFERHLMFLPDARILARAAVPTQTESSKKRLVVLGASSFLGLLMGAALVFWRTFPIGVFRTADQVKTSLGLMCLVVPKVKKKHAAQLTEYGLDMPYSRFAESLRLLWSLIRIAQREKNAKVICVVSAVANEGKTTISSNLASQVSMHAAMRTLLIDCDFHKQSLTRAIAPDAKQGLSEALDDPERLAELVIRKERSEIDVLPCPLPERAPNAAQALGSQKMEDLINRARASYDLIIIEAPPIAAIADCRMMASLCDGFVLVVEWGKTSQRLVLETMGDVPNFWERILCVVLNKADPTALKSIERYKGRNYHSYFVERPSYPKREDVKSTV